ncbi:MAG TPA: HAD family hydrolase [Candidatus Dormibacteraeota bacterium]|nr:HAD family hydrolase [Candidatus Dormibacteraeota bacterium]
MKRQTLLVDADDTLWENNLFFEQAIAEFIARTERLGYSAAYVRRILNEIEKRNIRQHGYGVGSFRRSLEETYRRLAGELAHGDEWAWIRARAREIEHTPPRILAGVPETLAFLARRHRLILFTKGEPAEQGAKIERSGLISYFEAVEITAEKDAASYERVVSRHKIVKRNAWMVGNSPKSDVNPALEAGLNVVFIPHRLTWELEHAELLGGAGRLLLLISFGELRQHF